jgi:dephospho-CoA kinase
MENPESKIIIALVGRICSGKGTISDHLAKKYGAAVLSFSDPMREMLRILHQDVTRANIQKISLAVRTQFGEDAFSTMIKGQSLARTESMIVLDPIRRSQDIEAFPAGSLVILGVTRDDEQRYQSMRNRNREKSDSDVTPEQFQILDNAETETQINDLVAKADHIIENNGTIEELLKKTDTLIDTLLVSYSKE